MSDYPLLVPLTDEAKEALDGRDHIAVTHVPFRIGRESRRGNMDGIEFYLERRKDTAAPRNDLYLNDRGNLLHVSRQHLVIDLAADGAVCIHDLGSRCGTHVDGVSAGGTDEPGTLLLGHGSEIVVGTSESPYRFTIHHLDRFAGLVPQRAGPQRG